MRDYAAVRIGCNEVGVEMGGTEIARDEREQLDVLLAQADCVVGPDLIECPGSRSRLIGYRSTIRQITAGRVDAGIVADAAGQHELNFGAI